MKTIRNGVFETNSSSTHSLTMCTLNEYKEWEDGKRYWNRWNDELVDISECDFSEYATKCFDSEDEYRRDEGYYTHEEFNDYDYIEYETFYQLYETKEGSKVVSFGYYGNDY